MKRDGMGVGTPEDQRGLNELLALVAPTIGDVVIGLMRRGKPLSTLGALFERAFDGKVSGGVEDRTELARRVLSDSRFSAAALAMLLENLRNAGPTELPIVLLVDRGEGLWAVAVRRVRGEGRGTR